MESPKVVIVILNWNGWPNTSECLQSLRNVQYSNYEAVVVDNGSHSEDLAHLRRWNGFATVLEQAENLGFSGGSNVGIRHALRDSNAEYVLILNNDTVVEPGFLTEMVKTAQSKSVDMVSPTVLVYADRKTVDRLGIIVSKALLGYDMKRWEGKEPFCPSGCCGLYSRRLLEAIEVDGQYFDEDFFAYAEDVDLGIRAALLGYRSALAPGAVIYHKGSATTFVHSPFSLFHGHRNTVWYMAKSVPTSILLRHAFWILAGQILPVFSNIRRRRALSVMKAKFQALRGMPKMLRKRRVIQKKGDADVSAIEDALDRRPFYLSGARVMRFLGKPIALNSGLSPSSPDAGRKEDVAVHVR